MLALGPKQFSTTTWKSFSNSTLHISLLTIQKLISYRKIILFGLVTAKLFSDPIDSYWQQKVDYDMDIVLHDSIRQITGKSTIKYTNNSPDSLDRIYMHLYPNAFQVGSVKYREYIGNSGRESRAKYFKNRLDGFTSNWNQTNFFSKELQLGLGLGWIYK